MKLRYIFLLFMLAFSALKAQQPDTLSFPDSSIVIIPDSAAADTAAIFTAFTDSTAIDTLKPLYQRPFSPYSTFISQRKILMNDYRNVSDLLKQFPGAFTNERGLGGYPEFTYLYAYPLKQNAFIPLSYYYNGNYSVAYDLNLIQTESIDSIEILSLPQSIRYSYNNRPGIVNYIPKDFISQVPYTRIKYYEGAFNEAMFDGIFSTLITRNLNFYIDVTNRSADKSYENTDFSLWMMNTKMKYMLSNQLNITGTYSFAKMDQQINGGINIDGVLASSNPEELLYDEIKAPVNFPMGRRDVLQHNFQVQALWEPSPEWFTDLRIYSLFNQLELDSIYDAVDPGYLKFKDDIYGITLDQSYHNPLYKINLLFSYNDVNIRGSYFDFPAYKYSNNPVPSNRVYTFSPSVTFYLDDSTNIASAFFSQGDNSFAFGADILFKFKSSGVYIGLSRNDDDYHNTFLEAGYTYNTQIIFAKLFYAGTNGYGSINAKFVFPFWKLSLEADGYYALNSFAVFPDYNLITGIFYKDILFRNSLDLKAGFKFYLSEGMDPSSDNPAAFLFADNNYRIDFTLAGEIKKAAVLYFTWENLTNNNYFLSPYYPMRERNIRFGVSWELLE